MSHSMTKKEKQSLQNRENQKQDQSPKATLLPAVDILELEDEYRIIADMPGSCRSDIDLNFQHGELTVRGSVTKRCECPDSCTESHQHYRAPEYFRVFRVGDRVQGDKISADYDLGVLTIHLPKRVESKPQRINVQGKAS